jgi:hypothetical protein
MALERIAALAKRSDNVASRPATEPQSRSDVDIADIASRLDSLIAQIRSALSG